MAKTPTSRYIIKKDGSVIIRSTKEHIGTLVLTTEDGWSYYEPRTLSGEVVTTAHTSLKEVAAAHLRMHVHGMPTPAQSAAQKDRVADLITALLAPTLAADGDTTALREVIRGLRQVGLIDGFHDQFICTDKELEDIAKVFTENDYLTERVRFTLERKAAE